MDPGFITPFEKAIPRVFDTAMQVEVVVGKPRPIGAGVLEDDVACVVDLQGEVSGRVILRAPANVAEAITMLFAGSPQSVDDEDFADAFGEITSMICGRAKSRFECDPVAMTCPRVIFASNERIDRHSNQPGLAIPCRTDCGEFVVEVMLRGSSGSPGAGTSPAREAARRG